MSLRSVQFRNNARLQSALITDSSHVTQGSQGEHVRLIQQVLVRLGERLITGREYAEALYGPTTAAAVLRFKTQRRIINSSYQDASGTGGACGAEDGGLGRGGAGTIGDRLLQPLQRLPLDKPQTPHVPVAVSD